MMYGAPISAPCSISSMAALSRTERVKTCSTAAPCHICPYSGPAGTRPRDGLSPNNPQYADGIRIEPPPSPPPAKGAIPEATAAAEPPLEPPGVRAIFHGLRVGPNASGSVYAINPNSGVLVLPNITTPELMYRFATSL